MGSETCSTLLGLLLIDHPKSYVIHWLSKSPLTAWCEVHTKGSTGRVSEGVAKCEMDATNPKTQRRSTTGASLSGKPLGFYGSKLTGKIIKLRSFATAHCLSTQQPVLV